MSENILWEIATLVAGVWKGVCFAWIYDNIRILRRVFIHRKTIMIALEDVIYGIYVGMSLFLLCLDRSDGVIRGFIIGGVVCGVLMYLRSVSKLYVKYSTGFLKLIIPFRKRKCNNEIRNEKSKSRKA